ncbi:MULTISPECIES: carboxypeptidase-like regulatory domain-containing protein [Microbacterium]|uniref:carboxypeptidase-like regulatory domain-containing protein n=1 Tax=Microbacterium TaxID=33882 RepID=UPI0012EEC375|nr:MULTISPECIES: carboxypeptidase-like regulatory domain-containing protein [Microbacterium]MDR7188904.1 5-hydroxyisourate hydrolase-like protein (transthyretin family) [Microbacterium sp. BE35]
MTAVWGRSGSRYLGVVLAVLVLLAGVLGATPARADDTGSISGVVAAEDGTGADSVSVIAHRYQSAWGYWAWHTSVATDASGAYTLSGLPDGDYRIEFRPFSGASELIAEYWDDAGDILSAKTISVVSGAAVVDIDAELGVGAALSGEVSDEAGEPITGVSVRAIDDMGRWASSGFTDATGAYRLAGLRTGSYLLEFAPALLSAAFAGEWWDDAASRSQATSVAVTAGTEHTGYDAVLGLAGSVAGTVTDSDGTPASGVGVSVYHAEAWGAGEWAGSATTDETGAYAVLGLAAGDYKVAFWSSGSLLGEWFDDAPYADTARTVSVGSGATATADAELTIGATVTGVVTDEAGAPVADVAVWARPVNIGGPNYASGVSTSSDGSFTLTGLTPGDYRVQFMTDNASVNVVGEWWNDARTEAAATVLSLAPGEVATDVSARLAVGASITGVLRDGEGAPSADAQVTLYDSEGQWLRDGRAGADGSYELRGLEAGTYRVGFTTETGGGAALKEWWHNAPDVASADDIVVGTAATISGIDAVLSLDDESVLETFSATLSGVVTDALGNPLEGVSVVIDAGSWGDGARTDADGRWTSLGLPADSYRVSFSTEIDGALISEWWDDVADRGSATVIRIANGEQRTGIDAVLGSAVLPVLESSIPKITGPLRVGKTVKAHPRGWTEGTQFAFQWFADGAPIPNASGESLVLTPDIAGARLTVAVTGTLAGYQTVVESSEATRAVASR